MATVSATPSDVVEVEAGTAAKPYMEAARASQSARGKAAREAHKLWERATNMQLPRQVQWRDEEGRLWILEASVTARLVPKSDQMEVDNG